MGHLTMRGVPVYVNPTLQAGLDALSGWLEDHHYSQHARESILAHTGVHGTPTGSDCLEPEDEAGASEAFADALEPVPASSASWEDRSVYLDVGSILEAAGGRGGINAAGRPGDDDPMAFPPSRPSDPLPDRLTPEALAGAGRSLASFDRPW